MNDASRHDKPALPADAVTAAVAVLIDKGIALPFETSDEIATAMLEAAAPAIRDQATAAERERILGELAALKRYVSYPNPIQVPDAVDLGGEIVAWKQIVALLDGTP